MHPEDSSERKQEYDAAKHRSYEELCRLKTKRFSLKVGLKYIFFYLFLKDYFTNYII